MNKTQEALKLALEALEEINKLSIGENAICFPAEIDTAMDAIREALAEQPAQQQEPLACKDEMCACRGGPCASCPDGESEKELADVRDSRDFYKRRTDELQKAQSQMRDPERTMVCDILANGRLLVPAGGRYSTSPPASKPWVGLTDEEVAAAARMLSDRQAAACNVDCGDMWKLHGNDFIDDARAALEAAHGIKGDA